MATESLGTRAELRLERRTQRRSVFHDGGTFQRRSTEPTMVSVSPRASPGADATAPWSTMATRAPKCNDVFGASTDGIRYPACWVASSEKAPPCTGSLADEFTPHASALLSGW